MNGSAESRFREIATFALGLSMVVTGFADLPAIAAQQPHLAAWWWYPAIVLNLGATLAYLVLPWLAAHLLRTVYLVYAFGSLLVLLTIPLAGELPDDLGSAWPLRLISSFGVSAALALSAGRVCGYIVILGVTTMLSAWAGSGDPVAALETTLVDLSVAVPFALIVLAVRSTGRALDAASASAIEAARRDASSAAAALERRRVEMLAHDHILYTLRATALGLPTAALARTTLERLSQTGDPSDTDFVTRLRSLTTQLAPAASFSMRGKGEIPSEIADSLVEAAGEALRNCVTHAPGAAIRVSVELAPGTASVTIADDGPGFRFSRLPSGRLGVSRSIIERVRSVAGGTARIRSVPGGGTAVELGWASEQGDAR